MEINDWEADTMVLTGLSLDMKPSKAHDALDLELFEPFQESMITGQLKIIGTRLYCHKKLMPFYQDNVDGQNTLAHFLCDSYETPNSPRKKGHERHRLRDSRPRALHCWDNLYYALVAEVRQFYADLQFEYGSKFERGTVTLHQCGYQGASTAGAPWTVAAMAGQLEEFWRALMDPRLVATLDTAVRVQISRQKVLYLLETRTVEPIVEGGYHDYPSEGLMDVNSMSPEELMDALWSKYDNEKRIEESRQSGANIENSTFLAFARAEVREAGLVRSSSKPQTSHPCECNDDCNCHAECSRTPGICVCKKRRVNMDDLFMQQHATDVAARKRLNLAEDEEEPTHHLFGAVTNELAQMQVAARAMPTPLMNQVAQESNAAVDKFDADILQYHRRPRAGTETSADLAYVPPPRNTPIRGVKDVFPLGFYGGNSGQRYPPFRPEAMNGPPPTWGKSMVSRKPIPPPITTSQLSSSAESRRRNFDDLPTPPTTSPYNIPYFTESKQHAANSASSPIESEGLNPIHRQAYEANLNPTHSSASKANKGRFQHQVDIGGKHVRSASPPSTNTACDIQNPKSRSFDQPRYIPAPPVYTRKLHEQIKEELSFLEDEEGNYKPTFKAPEAPKAPKAPSPRPVLKQRYVSAGGTEKLANRAEIPAPPLVEQTQAALARGTSMSRDELMGALSNPDFVRTHFGEAAIAVNERLSAGNGTSALRRSDESEEAVMVHGEKRERTTSSASLTGGRFDKLRRVFSRKSSECE